MPRIVIDGTPIDVTPGTKVIDAAAQLGIVIPRFCYHPCLGAVGACRMCAVLFTEGPVKGVEMSCMTDALDGMEVSTTAPEAVEFRQYIIELLMLNHPHDCPVCDEGGLCLLQDMTVSGGHSLRRYQGAKRTYYDQYLGPLVQHEMNRCIHCWRCRRFYQEFSGYRDLGAQQIADRTWFGRFQPGALESPFAGNLIDICPTGVFTDKPARFTGRHWDWQRSPSLCIHCSLGCHTVASARYFEVMRVEARHSGKINGYFICDRGRFGFSYTNNPQRPRRARINGNTVDVDTAVARAAERLQLLQAISKAKTVACHVSARAGFETQAAVKRLCALLAWDTPTYFIDNMSQRTTTAAVARIDTQTATTLGEIEKADVLLAVGVDPVNEAPMLALAMRQAFRSGAFTAVIDPRPVSLPLEFEHAALSVDEIDCCLGALIRETVPRSILEGLGEEACRFYDSLPAAEIFEEKIQERITAAAVKLRESRRPVVICGTAILKPDTPALAADLAALLRMTKPGAGLFYALPSAGSYTAALLAEPGRSFSSTVEAIEQGAVKALILVESDPFRDFPDRHRLEQAFNRLDFLLVMDCLPSHAAQRADIFLPAATLFEAGGSFANQTGLLQFAPALQRPGMPLSQVSAGGHPPRVFSGDVPGGEAEPAWRLVEKLAGALSPKLEKQPGAYPWKMIAKLAPVFSDVAMLGEKSGRVMLAPLRSACRPFQTGITRSQGRPRESHMLELLMVDWTFGTEELSGLSAPLQQAEQKPYALLHPADGKRAGLRSGEIATLQLDSGTLEVELRFCDTMASGTLIMPRHHALAWQKVKEFPAMVNTKLMVNA